MLMNAMIAMLNISIGAQAAVPAQAAAPTKGSLLGGKASSGKAFSGEFAGILNASMVDGVQAASGTVSTATLNMLGANALSLKDGQTEKDAQTDAADNLQASLAGVPMVPAQAAVNVPSIDAQAITVDTQALASVTPDGSAAARLQVPVTAQATVIVQAQVASAPEAIAQATNAVLEGVSPTLENPVVKGLETLRSIKDSGAITPELKNNTDLNSNILDSLKTGQPAVSADLMARLSEFGGGKANPFIKNMGNHQMSGKGMSDPKAEAFVSSGKSEGGAVAQSTQVAVAATPATGGGHQGGSGSQQGFSSYPGQAEAALAASMANSVDDEAPQLQSGTGKGFMLPDGLGTQTTMSETVVKAQVASSVPANLSRVIQVNDQSFSVIRRSDHSLELTLQPEGLGKLHLEVSVSKGVVTAHINAPDQASKDQIERNLQGILDELQKEGLDLGGFSVDVRNGNGEQVADQGKNNEGRENGSGGDDDELVALDAVAQANKSIINSDRLVSVYA